MSTEPNLCHMPVPPLKSNAESLNSKRICALFTQPNCTMVKIQLPRRPCYPVAYIDSEHMLCLGSMSRSQQCCKGGGAGTGSRDTPLINEQFCAVDHCSYSWADSFEQLHSAHYRSAHYSNAHCSSAHYIYAHYTDLLVTHGSEDKAPCFWGLCSVRNP